MSILKMKDKKRGFTLLELLVVVAIIAVIVSVTLVVLSDSRDKGADAAIKANLNTIRGQSELFYSNNSNSFLPSGGTDVSGICPSYNPSGTSMFSNDKTISDAIVEAVKRGGNGSACYNSSINWAVAIGLKSDANTAWCVDSGGNSKLVSSVPASAINSGTLLCN